MRKSIIPILLCLLICLTACSSKPIPAVSDSEKFEIADVNANEEAEVVTNTAESEEAEVISDPSVEENSHDVKPGGSVLETIAESVAEESSLVEAENSESSVIEAVEESKEESKEETAVSEQSDEPQQEESQPPAEEQRKLYEDELCVFRDLAFLTSSTDKEYSLTETGRYTYDNLAGSWAAKLYLSDKYPLAVREGISFAEDGTDNTMECYMTVLGLDREMELYRENMWWVYENMMNTYLQAKGMTVVGEVNVYEDVIFHTDYELPYLKVTAEATKDGETHHATIFFVNRLGNVYFFATDIVGESNINRLPESIRPAEDVTVSAN